MFFTCYNSELAHTLLEVNASQKDKDFIGALNWKKCEEYIKAGKGRKSNKYLHNVWNEETHSADLHRRGGSGHARSHRTGRSSVYFMPCPKSPHGCDTDPTGSYIVGSGKLAALIPVFSFDKMHEGDRRQGL
jgi:nitrous-oxide reductase